MIMKAKSTCFWSWTSRIGRYVPYIDFDSICPILNFIFLGAMHRRQRKMLNPLFTVASLQSLTPTMYAVAYEMRDAIKKNINAQKTSVDLVGWCARGAMELIGQAGLGVAFGALREDSDMSTYVRAAKEIKYANFII